MITEVELPEKLSDLLELALKDLAKVERSKKYIVDMLDWHLPLKNGKCKVCLAGAVLAKTQKLPLNVDFTDITLGDDSKFYALDDIRRGRIRSALVSMNLRYHGDIPDNVEVIPYNIDKKLWRNDMKKILALLRKHNY